MTVFLPFNEIDSIKNFLNSIEINCKQDKNKASKYNISLKGSSEVIANFIYSPQQAKTEKGFKLTLNPQKTHTKVVDLHKKITDEINKLEVNDAVKNSLQQENINKQPIAVASGTNINVQQNNQNGLQNKLNPDKEPERKIPDGINKPEVNDSLKNSLQQENVNKQPIAVASGTSINMQQNNQNGAQNKLNPDKEPERKIPDGINKPEVNDSLKNSLQQENVNKQPIAAASGVSINVQQNNQNGLQNKLNPDKEPERKIPDGINKPEVNDSLKNSLQQENVNKQPIAVASGTSINVQQNNQNGAQNKLNPDKEPERKIPDGINKPEVNDSLKNSLQQENVNKQPIAVASDVNIHVQQNNQNGAQNRLKRKIPDEVNKPEVNDSLKNSLQQENVNKQPVAVVSGANINVQQNAENKINPGSVESEASIKMDDATFNQLFSLIKKLSKCMDFYSIKVDECRLTQKYLWDISIGTTLRLDKIPKSLKNKITGKTDSQIENIKEQRSEQIDKYNYAKLHFNKQINNLDKITIFLEDMCKLIIKIAVEVKEGKKFYTISTNIAMDEKRGKNLTSNPNHEYIKGFVDYINNKYKIGLELPNNLKLPEVRS